MDLAVRILEETRARKPTPPATTRPALACVTAVLAPMALRSHAQPPQFERLPHIGPRWPACAVSAAFSLVDAVLDSILCPALNAFRAKLALPPVRRVYHAWFLCADCVALFPAWFASPPDWPRTVVLSAFPLFDDNPADRGNPGGGGGGADGGNDPAAAPPIEEEADCADVAMDLVRSPSVAAGAVAAADAAHPRASVDDDQTAAAIAALPPSLRRFVAAARADRAPLVAVTLGTAPPLFAEAVFASALAATAGLGARCVVLASEAAMGSLLTAGPLPGHAAHCAYAPFSALLRLCAAVLHNGGVGTTSQALRAGCPQLVVAVGFDQFDNAARVAAIGVGARLPRRAAQRPAALAAALGRLMREPAVAAACAKASARFLRPKAAAAGGAVGVGGAAAAGVVAATRRGAMGGGAVSPGEAVTAICDLRLAAAAAQPPTRVGGGPGAEGGDDATSGWAGCCAVPFMSRRRQRQQVNATAAAAGISAELVLLAALEAQRLGDSRTSAGSATPPLQQGDVVDKQGNAALAADHRGESADPQESAAAAEQLLLHATQLLPQLRVRVPLAHPPAGGRGILTAAAATNNAGEHYLLSEKAETAGGNSSLLVPTT